MSKFKIGDKVVINPISEYFDKDYQLPRNVTATVTNIYEGSDHPYDVLWEDGSNRYKVEDLILYKEINMEQTKNVHPLPPTTTRVTVGYKNGQTYTFPNCNTVKLSRESVQGESKKVFTEEGVSVKSYVDFEIQLSELSAINIRGKEDYVSSEILIEEGLVLSITDTTDPDDLAKPRDFIVV